MNKTAGVKEEIAFLTRLLTMLMGAVILAVGGVSSLHLNDERSLIYWLGGLAIAVLTVICSGLILRIWRQIRRLEVL